MTRGDGGLQGVRSEEAGLTKFQSPIEGVEAAADEQLIPARAILVEQEDGFAVGAEAGCVA